MNGKIACIIVCEKGVTAITAAFGKRKTRREG
jgi:hypothetical protein